MYSKKNWVELLIEILNNIILPLKQIKTSKSVYFQSISLLDVFTVDTACATEGFFCFVFCHLLYDPSTEQLNLLESLFEPMQLPSFSSLSPPVCCCNRWSQADSEISPRCETEAPRLFSVCFFAKNESCRLSDTIACFLRCLMSLWPKPASELWYRVLLLFLWDN